MRGRSTAAPQELVMSESVSERTRANLARSLPIVRRHKEEIVSHMRLYLRQVDEGRDSPGRSDIAATVLAELILRQAGLIVDSGQTAGLETAAAEHRTLGIDGRHYSRFGDALVPVLRDVLGDQVPREIPSAWCDAFWAVVRAARRGGGSVAPEGRPPRSAQVRIGSVG
jgi:hemoglobin-like flavoprotein